MIISCPCHSLVKEWRYDPVLTHENKTGKLAIDFKKFILINKIMEIYKYLQFKQGNIQLLCYWETSFNLEKYSLV